MGRPWLIKNAGAFMRFERERKNGRRPRDKKYPATKQKIRPVQLNGPHSKGCWVFIYTGRGQSSSIIQRLLRETQWNIRVFKAVRMKGRRVVTS